MGQHHDVTFPNETDDYRAARDSLLAAEIELRRQAEAVAAERRALPPGGTLKQDYVFLSLAGDDVRLSQLFTEKSDDLLIYSFMYKTGGQACPACTSLLDSLNGGAAHIKQNLNLAVVAKAEPATLKAWADGRNWANLTLLSSGQGTYNADYKAEAEDESQLPMVNVFRKTDGGIVHTWASELLYAAAETDQHPRHVDQIWPLWSVYDLTPAGRPADWFPALAYT